MRFYECRHCGNIITYQREVRLAASCCGRVMLEMEYSRSLILRIDI